ncbi:MAG: hypothetical protein J0M29_21845, partial [Chitinophagales bacterium]|nr:hypothetical protein [Chitinophagales bacterium]
MKRKIFTSLKCLLAGVLFLSSWSVAMASYTATATTSTTTYVAGASNTFVFSVKITSNATFEWVDNMVFTFPAGWTVTAGTGPSPYNFCGGGQGNYAAAANVASWTVPGHALGTQNGTGCGPFDDGTYNFSITATAPANASGPITVTVRTEGDGYPSPYTDAQIQSFPFQFAQLVPCGLVCPGNLNYNLDPGACSQVVNYDVFTTGVCQIVSQTCGFVGSLAPAEVDFWQVGIAAGNGLPPQGNSGSGPHVLFDDAGAACAAAADRLTLRSVLQV